MLAKDSRKRKTRADVPGQLRRAPGACTHVRARTRNNFPAPKARVPRVLRSPRTPEVSPREYEPGGKKHGQREHEGGLSPTQSVPCRLGHRNRAPAEQKRSEARGEGPWGPEKAARGCGRRRGGGRRRRARGGSQRAACGSIWEPRRSREPGHATATCAGQAQLALSHSDSSSDFPATEIQSPTRSATRPRTDHRATWPGHRYRQRAAPTGRLNTEKGRQSLRRGPVSFDCYPRLLETPRKL